MAYQVPFIGDIICIRQHSLWVWKGSVCLVQRTQTFFLLQLSIALRLATLEVSIIADNHYTRKKEAKNLTGSSKSLSIDEHLKDCPSPFRLLYGRAIITSKKKCKTNPMRNDSICVAPHDRQSLTISHVVEVHVSVSQRAPSHGVAADADRRHGPDLLGSSSSVQGTGVPQELVIIIAA